MDRSRAATSSVLRWSSVIRTRKMIGDQCEFPAILKGYDMAFDWVRKNGYEPIESPREIWHSELGESARMEIALPFK